MMKIINLLAEKSGDAYHKKPATIGIIGDSVSNGCFEVIDHHDGGIEAIYDTERNYASELRKILMTLFPFGQVNIVNAAINGDSAPGGLSRIERDLLPQKPDLVIICYGLNDVNAGEDGIGRYKAAMKGMIDKCHIAGAEVIVMTPQPMCFYVSERIMSDTQRNIAGRFSALQNSGVMDKYMLAARETASVGGAVLCDCYADWMKMKEGGVDTTMLLSNLLNHPSRDMHKLFAYELVRTMFGC